MTPADLAESMVPVACDLACRVRDGDAEGIARLTASLGGAETPALLIVLAAMIPVDDASPADLLAWAGSLEDPPGWRQEPLPGEEDGYRELKPCGTYAAYRRHERRGEPPDPRCDRAYREWRAERHQARRGRPQQEEAARAA